MGNQDKGYKKLFSNKEMVRDLLTGFIDPEIVKDLDLDFRHMIREPSDFVTDDLRERFDDIIWRVKFRDQALYLCILIEFQSTEDRWMAVRLLTYLGLLYEDILRRGLLADGRLPPVLPVVIHTGRRPWRTPCSLGALAATVSPSLSRYRPSLDYLLLDGASFRDEDLANEDNLAAVIFRMEKSREPVELVEEVRKLGRVLAMEDSAHLRRAFAVFLSRVLLPRKTGREDLPEISELAEVERMIVEQQADWAETWLKEGEAKGMVLGRELGIKLGEERGLAQARRELILKMFDKGLSIANIAQWVDLPEKEIRNLVEGPRNS